ncbi:hypothetical protein CSKR_103109 [Clonorchis sinensis]|uniref:Uncharacterized protein n=1 Tax=Clonorchis sinensis TaxID=79923 RepID=A0A3R7F2D1_CLOSI|nr:hypothetical protein CSKR_103109 [Clonorchis sinensis]
MCCTRPPHVSVATIIEISRYMYTRNALLIRLLKILPQPTTECISRKQSNLGSKGMGNKREAKWPKWLERECTDRKVRGLNPTSASRLPLSRLGQPGSS